VAAKLALQKYAGEAFDVRVCYCDTGSEHPDNQRFLKDVERWLGVKIIILQSDKYKSVDEVIEGERFLVGPNGAPCTKYLKKLVRRAYQDPDDIQVFGFDADEADRVRDFQKNNPEVQLDTPLLHHKLSKGECLTLCRAAGVEPPITYKQGYRNANCIGCVKGGMGYWNKIRVDYPEVFARRARQEREIGASILKEKVGDKYIPVFLDELAPNRGRYSDEPEIACGLFCGEVMDRLGIKKPNPN
jgi:hypothetical protein